MDEIAAPVYALDEVKQQSNALWIRWLRRSKKGMIVFDIMIGMIVSGPWRPVHKKRLRARVPSFTAYLWEVLFLSPLSRLNGLVGIRTGVVLCCVVLFVFFCYFLCVFLSFLRRTNRGGKVVGLTLILDPYRGELTSISATLFFFYFAFHFPLFLPHPPPHSGVFFPSEKWKIQRRNRGVCWRGWKVMEFG